jgi:hypothetical protein
MHYNLPTNLPVGVPRLRGLSEIIAESRPRKRGTLTGSKLMGRSSGAVWLSMNSFLVGRRRRAAVIPYEWVGRRCRAALAASSNLNKP